MRSSLALALALTACLQVLCGAAFAQEPPLIIPAPKQIEVLDGAALRVQRDRAPLLVLADTCRQARIGADEINGRIVELGAAPLEVVAAGDLTEARRAGTNLIVIRCDGDSGPQGYSISFADEGGRTVVTIAGGDALGALYGCVTVRWLLQADEEGVSLPRYRIADRPDVRWRHTWLRPRDALRAATGWDGRRERKPEAGLAVGKATVDWLLRHKLNCFFISELTRGEPDPEFDSWLAELLEYAFERGVWAWASPVGFSLGIGTTDDPKPELDLCATLRRGGEARYWCWSRDDMARAAYADLADQIAAKLPADTGIAGPILTLHMPDTGNMLWHERCEQCRERFGNDQAAAQANLLNLFYEQMKARLPSARIVLVTRPYYPYDPRHPNNAVYGERMARIAELIPDDVHMVHVQGPRGAIAAWEQAVGDQPMAHWVNGASTDLDLEFRLNLTYRGGPRDMIYQGSWYGNGALEILGAAQYTWTLDSPGATTIELDPEEPYFEGHLHDTGGTVEERKLDHSMMSNMVIDGMAYDRWMWVDLQTKAGPEALAFVQRAAEYLYGPEAAGPALDILGSGMPRYSGYEDDPVAYAGGRDAEPWKMEGAIAGLEREAPARERLWAEGIALKPGMYAGGQEIEGYGTAEVSLPLGGKLALDSYATLALCRSWLPLLQAREALAAEDWDRASADIEAARTTLAAQREELRAVYDRLAAYPEIGRELRPEHLEAALDRLEKVSPGLELIAAEVQARGAMRRFNPMPFDPLYESGPIKVAIYRPDPGKVVGAEGIMLALQAEPGIEPAWVNNMGYSTLSAYHCVILPDCKEMPPGHLTYIDHLRRYVASGGGVYVQHDSIGHQRFPLHASPFPEVGGYGGRADSNRVRVAVAHPIVAGHEVGAELTHMYWDHEIVDTAGRGGEAVLVDADSGEPVVAVGQVGRGRVIMDGSIAYASSRTEAGAPLAAQLGVEGDFEAETYGLSRELLVNGIRWLVGAQ